MYHVNKTAEAHRIMLALMGDDPTALAHAVYDLAPGTELPDLERIHALYEDNWDKDDLPDSERIEHRR